MQIEEHKMIDQRIGKRIKQCRERLGLTQEEFAAKTGFSVNYISTLERGASFPRCEKLITLLNALGASADEIFCDVVYHSCMNKANNISMAIASLPPEGQQRVLNILEFVISQEEKNKE